MEKVGEKFDPIPSRDEEDEEKLRGGEGRRKIDKRKKKRRAEIEGGEGKRRDKREGGRKKISNKKGTPLIRAPSNHFLLSTLMVDDAYRARVCSKHRKGYSGRERG